ncbi:MAG TPA: BON domain-containing protein [Abditibacterium sp.]
MAHLVQKPAPLSNRYRDALLAPAVALPVSPTFDQENMMKTAEHSLQKHRASQGAFPPAIPMDTSSDLMSPHALLAKSLSAPTFGPDLSINLSWRRPKASGCALVAVLALGCIGSVSGNAHATPWRLKNSVPAGVSKAHTLSASVAERSLSVQTAPPLTAIAESRSARLPQAPRAGLMPRATAFKAPMFPGAAPGTKPLAPRSMNSIARSVTSTQGGGKMIRLAQLARPAKAAASQAPLRPAAPEALPANFDGMKKVIHVPTLSLPPLSKPLPRWMQNAAVKVERLDKKPVGPTRNRLAQNPLAPPVRNPAVPVTNSDRLPNQIEVAVSTFVVLLTTTDLQTVAVADPGIADVAVVNSRSVLLNGKSAGVTSLVIVDGQKIRQYTVRVTAAPGSRPVDVTAAIGLPGVSVRPLRDALVLEGEVGSGEEARRALEIAGIYSPKVINQLTIRGQVSQEAGNAAQLRDLINLPDINVRVVGDTAVLTGTVATPQQIQDADIIARTVVKNVINQLRLPALSAEQVRESLGAVAQPLTPSLLSPGQLSTAAPLTVREAGGQIIIEGTVASQADADIALSTANRTGFPIINRIQVRPAPTSDQAFVSQVAAAIGRPGVIVRGTPKRLVLEGTVSDTNEAVLVEQVARAFTTPGLGQVDNLLRTSNTVQCNVDVSIIEINSTDARNLGIEYGSATLLSETQTPGSTNTSVVGGATVTNVTPPTVSRTVDPAFKPGVGLAGRRFGGLGSTQFLDPFLYRINALATQGKARILSNPRTTVLSGRTATFQVGGQVPIPSGSTTNGSGTSTTIVFKDYGILLDIVPNALQNGNVTLRVRTEVSQPDFGVAVTPPGGGGPIPGFSRRSTITEVTVPAGGTVALSGLITADESVTTSSVPILSKIPIIGSLFRSKNFRNNQSELVIFVKPRVLPNPLAGNSDAFVGVTAAGENTNRAAQMGNPGLSVFDGGGGFSAPTTTQ